MGEEVSRGERERGGVRGKGDKESVSFNKFCIAKRKDFTFPPVPLTSLTGQAGQKMRDWDEFSHAEAPGSEVGVLTPLPQSLQSTLKSCDIEQGGGDIEPVITTHCRHCRTRTQCT